MSQPLSRSRLTYAEYLELEETDRATCPDVTVVCGRLEHAAEDPGEKFAHCRRLGSLREYLLISQRARRFEVYRRRDERWMLDEAGVGQTLRLESIDVALPVDEVSRDPLAEL